MKKILLLILFILLAGCGGTKNVPVEQVSVEQPKESIVWDSTAERGTFTDSRDGRTYKTTKIGEQVWMAENLNYEVDGSKCYGEGGKAYDKNYKEITLSSSEIQANCNKYGRLYDWATAMGIDPRFNKEEWNGSDVNHQGVCPNGWHLPSNAEWDKLCRYVDGDTSKSSPYHSKTAGKYLMATSGWNDYEGRTGNGEDTYGFSALPGGTSINLNVGYYGDWLSSSSIEGDSDYVYSRLMGYNKKSASYSYGSKDTEYSVRCVRD